MTRRMPSRPAGRLAPAPSILCALGLALPAATSAQDAPSEVERRILEESYTVPTAAIAEAALAPRWENVSASNLDPTGSFFVHTVSDGPASLPVFARPHLNLGALQIDPAADRYRRLTTRSAIGFHLISAEDGARTEVEVPRDARVSNATWSPDGMHLAFMAHYDEGTHIYVADRTGSSRRVTRDEILAVHVRDLQWTTTGEIVTVLPPENRGAMPTAPEVPATPMVRRTSTDENRLRTYFDLLENPHEKALVEYFSTGQLAVIDAESRRVTRIGEPAMIVGVDAAPDGSHFRVERFSGDFSYIVPTTSSATVEELWSRDGEMLAVLDEREAREGVQSDDDDAEGDEPEKREMAWHPGGGLVFLQMEPAPEESDEGMAADEEGDDEERGPRMDRVVHWTAPFGEADAEILYETSKRVTEFAFDAEGGMIFLTRGNGGGRNGGGNQTVHAVDLSAPDEEYLVLRRRADDEITEDPGTILRMTGPAGTSVVRTDSDGAHVYREGVQYFEDPMVDAPRPFVDRVEIRTGEVERVFQSSADRYERVAASIDRDMTEIVVTAEGPTDVPQLVRMRPDGSDARTLTSNVDHTPDITAAHRETLMIERPDGFTSMVEVTMPVGWRPGDPAPPAMFWFYPREYTEQEQYDRQTVARYNRNDFPNMGTRSMEILTRSGYAVVDPDLPIVGERDQPNDSYILDLRNTLATVIDSLDARGLADRTRLGLGGHSYGAFGTANAMVNTPFFKAGIAGDGNYNRSLTPAGFQREPRQLWEAEQIYIEMSPFFVADRLTGSLLLYHGMDDHNVGTHPDHSRRLFHALNVLGKDAALYMYPFEDHGPATRETILDLWARWTAWLDVHVKGEGASRPITEDGA